MGDRIDARPGFKKDRADAIVGAIHGAVQGQGTTRLMKNIGNIQAVFGNAGSGRSDRLSGNAQEHREFERKKLHLKSMGIDVDNKKDSEIENLYRLYESTVLYLGC